MAPLTRNNSGKYKSKRIKNNLLKDSQKSNKIGKKKTNNNKHNKLQKMKEELIKLDIVNSLPLECSQKILLDISKDDVACAYNCSRNWRYIMSGDYFWKKRCQLDNYHVPDENNTSAFLREHLQKFDCYWQGLYSYYNALCYNWKNNGFKKILRNGSSSAHPRQIHYFDENILIVSTDKYKLNIIDSSTGNKIKTKLGGHRRTIINAVKIENYLVSYSYDSDFKVWDLSQDGLCTVNRSVPGYIQNMAVSKNVIAFDNHPGNQLFIYDFKGTLIYHQNTNLSYTFSICVYNNTVALAAMGGDIRIIEFNSKNSTPRMLSVLNGLSTIKIINGYLLCMIYTGAIFVYDINTLAYLHTISVYRGIKCIGQNKIVFNEADKRFVAVCDVTTGHSLLRIKNQYVMKLLAANSRFIVTEVPFKKLIKVWCCITKQLVTEISFQAIGLKSKSIVTACITNSKLALLCNNNGDYAIQRFLVLLNFENDKNVLIKN